MQIAIQLMFTLMSLLVQLPQVKLWYFMMEMNVLVVAILMLLIKKRANFN